MIACWSVRGASISQIIGSIGLCVKYVITEGSGAFRKPFPCFFVRLYARLHLARGHFEYVAHRGCEIGELGRSWGRLHGNRIARGPLN